MAVKFDPYHKWLGIPPKDQPPHHYRLLGLEVFEGDADVIDAAANRLMAYLHDLSTGQSADDAQRILNEISAARLCLLNPRRKAQYDQVLRRRVAREPGSDLGAAGRQGAVTEAVPPPPPSRVTAADPGVPARGPASEAAAVIGQLAQAEPAGQSVAWQTVRRKRQRRQAILAGLFVFALAMAGVAGLLTWLLREDANLADGDLAAGPQVVQMPPDASGVRADRELATIEFDWPPEQRHDVRITINGFDRDLPLEGDVRMKVNAGRNRIVILRPGYKSIRESLDVQAGESREFTPVWIADASPPPSELTRSTELRDDATEEETPGSGDPAVRDPFPALPGDSSPSVEVVEIQLNAYVHLPSVQDEQTIHDLGRVVAAEPIELELLGGDRVLGSGGRFQLSREDIEGARVWKVMLVNRQGEGQHVAHFAMVRGNLVFAWSRQGAPSEAERLRNCALRVVAGDQRKIVSLREPLVVETIPLAGPDGRSTHSVNVAHLPDPRSLRLQVLGLRGGGAIRYPFESAGLVQGESHRVRITSKDDLPVAIELEYSPRPSADSVQFECKLLYRRPDDEKLVFLSPKSVRQEHARLSQDLAVESRRLASLRSSREQAQDELMNQIGRLEMWTQYYSVLLELISGEQVAGLRYRLYADYGNHQVDLVTTELAAP